MLLLREASHYMKFDKNYLKKLPCVAIILLGLLMVLHLALTSKTFFVKDDGSMRTASAGYGDIPLHLTQISKFAFQSFDFEDPIYYGEKLHYPFLINLISGRLLRVTGWWNFSVMTPIYILIVANIVLAYL